MGASESMPHVTSGLCAIHEHKTATTSIFKGSEYKTAATAESCQLPLSPQSSTPPRSVTSRSSSRSPSPGTHQSGKRKRRHSKPRKSQQTKDSSREDVLETQLPDIWGHRSLKSEVTQSNKLAASEPHSLPTLLTSISTCQRAGLKSTSEKPKSPRASLLTATQELDVDSCACEPQRRLSVDSLTSRLSVESPATFRVLLDDLLRAPLRRATPYFSMDAFDSEPEVSEEGELPSMAWLQKAAPTTSEAA